MIISSSKRTYQISLKEKKVRSLLYHFDNLTEEGLQRYIDDCFSKSTGHAYSGGAIEEKRIYRDKAKLAVLFKEGISEGLDA